MTTRSGRSPSNGSRGLDLPDTELLTDFQLQVEHALDLVGRDEVIFIDAAVTGPEPFRFAPVTPARDASACIHAISPAALWTPSGGCPQRPCRRHTFLASGGYGFELGAPLSDRAAGNLEAAMQMLISRLTAS